MNNRRLKRRSTVTFLQLLARSSVFEPPRAARSCSDRPPPPPTPPSLQHHLLQKMPRLLSQGGFGDWSSAIIWARFCQTRVKGTRHRVPARSSARGHCSRCCCCSLNIIFFEFFFCYFLFVFSGPGWTTVAIRRILGCASSSRCALPQPGDVTQEDRCVGQGVQYIIFFPPPTLQSRLELYFNSVLWRVNGKFGHFEEKYTLLFWKCH